MIPPKFPCGIADEYEGVFSEDHAYIGVVPNIGTFAVARYSGELAVFTLLSCEESPANTIVFPIFGGLLHVHWPAAATMLDHKLSVLG
ncbi:MAG: hypothetical protein WCI00_07085 [bacterium]